MKMKRFFAANMQMALKDIREELGADAVILSTSRHEEGVEVICALDYNEESARATLSEDDPAKAADKSGALGEPLSSSEHRQHAPRPVQTQSSGDIARQVAARHQKLDTAMQDVRERLGRVRHDALQEEAQNHARGSVRSSAHRDTAKSHSRPLGQAPSASGGASAAVDETAALLAAMRDEINQLRAAVEKKAENASHGAIFPESQAFMTRQNQASNIHADSQVADVETKGVSATPLPVELQDNLLGMGISSELQQSLWETGQRNVAAEQLGALLGGDSVAREAMWNHMLALLSQRLPVEKADLIEQRGAVALVGPTGVGKTTTIAKMAARFVMQHGAEKLALVTTDRFRVAGSQLLQSFGRLLKVQVVIMDEHRTLDDVLDSLSDKQLVLIDTAGLTAQDSNWQHQQRDLQVRRHKIRNYLTLSAVSQPQVLMSIYHSYKQLNLQGCVITKLDEACSLGEVMSLAVLKELPVTYVTDGQKIPQDLHKVSSHTLVARAIRLWQTLPQWQQETGMQAG